MSQKADLITRGNRRGASTLLVAAAAALAAAASAAPVAAQTDYYNIDAGRPVRVEDAYPTERYAFELQVAPLRLERVGRGVYNWSVEPEIAYGILPRTHLEVGLPLSWTDASGPRSSVGLGGVDVSVLHNLNVETSGLPALGIAAEAILPVGNHAPDRLYPALKGIATRTFSFARFHLNGSYTLGAEPGAGEDAEGLHEVSRWMAGVAVDRTMPLRSMLLIADVYAEQPIHDAEELQWNAGAGVRLQWSPRLAVDAGIGRRLTGEPGWFVTFGSAYAFAVRSLVPVPLR